MFGQGIRYSLEENWAGAVLKRASLKKVVPFCGSKAAVLHDSYFHDALKNVMVSVLYITTKRKAP